MNKIKFIISSIIVSAILFSFSTSVLADNPKPPATAFTSAEKLVWEMKGDYVLNQWSYGYSWSQNSSSYNMTITAPYGDTSVLHGIMQGQALQNNTVIAFRNDVMSWLNNTTYGGKAIANILNDCKNYLNTTQSNLTTIKSDVTVLKNNIGGSSSGTLYGKLSTMDSSLNSIYSKLLDIAPNVSSDVPSGLKSGWGSSLSNASSTYPLAFASSYYANVIRELDAIRTGLPSGGSSGSSADYSSVLDDIYADTSHTRLTLDDIKDYSAHNVRWEENSNSYNAKVGTANSALATYKFLTNWEPTVESPLPTDNPFTLGTGFGDGASSDFWHSVDKLLRHTSYDATASRDALLRIKVSNESISDKLTASASSFAFVDKNSYFRPSSPTSSFRVNVNIPAASEITIYRANSSTMQSAKYLFVYADGSGSGYISAPTGSVPNTVKFTAKKRVTAIRIYPLNYSSGLSVYYHISYTEQTTSDYSVADLVANIRDILASPSDSTIREESSTVINNYNNTFVTGEHGLSGSDVVNIGSALSSTSELLDVDFDFSSLSSVISDISSEGLSFWSEDVHSALNPFVGDNDG